MILRISTLQSLLRVRIPAYQSFKSIIHLRYYHPSNFYRTSDLESTKADSSDIKLNTECICPVCCKKFDTRAALEKHSELHVKKHVCAQCNKRYSHRRTLVEHLKTHSEMLATVLQCELCSETFATRGALQTHHLWKHEPNPPQHQCSQEGCGKVYKTKDALAKHQTSHVRKPSFACPYCGELYLYQSSARQHLRICKKRPTSEGAVEDDS